MPVDTRDFQHMARALQLARNGMFTTHPNPRVGCVLARDGRIIGEGWHARAGGDHAEIAALKNCADARGATAYVTLEPCSHHGKTPPCADALIEAGIARVVAAMQDPNPLVAGNGLARLRAAGIATECGILEDDSRRLNPGFIKRMTEGRPFIRSKLAMSLDGRTALASGESKWITSHAARQDVHRLRAQSAAILTGIDTVLADDPALTARIDEDVRQPVRIVLDSRLRMLANAQLAKLPGRSLILTCGEDRQKIAALEDAGFEIHRLPEKNGRIDLNAVMVFLAAQQINELLVEAGPTLNGALLAENLVDEWIVYMAPCVLGDRGRGLFALNVDTMADKKMLKLIDARQIGPDLKLTYHANARF